jgi:hypothetical protein
MSEDDLMKAFTSMGIEDGQDGFMPMMQGMMKSLLSKDINIGNRTKASWRKDFVWRAFVLDPKIL